MPIKTYFLSPGWDIPASSPLLGSIITNPSQPDIALFKLTAPPTDLTTTTTTTTPTSFSFPGPPSPSNPALFSTFLTAHGLGPEPAFAYDRKHILGYSFRGQRAVEFTPNGEALRAAVGDVRVKTVLESQAGGGNTSVYLITGIKTVAGAGVSVASAKGKGWTVGLEVGRSTEVGQGAAEGDVIFALEVREVGMQGEEVTLKELDAEEGKLQARLDGEFGEGTFKVVKGVDEADGAECQIVTASPTYVDLLTASTVKVGGEHGIWY